MENKDLTTAQVAKILGVHRNTVARLVKDGKLNPYRITEGTGRMRFRLDDVEKFRDSEDVGQLQPNSIIKNYSVLVDGSTIPEILNNVLDKSERRTFAKILESANINSIFGRFMRNASQSQYAKALDGKSNAWVGETFQNILSKSQIKGSHEVVLYQLAGKMLSIGIGSVKLGGLHAPQITSLIFHADKGDIVIAGTIQQFLILDKGLLIMKREHAEAFFMNFHELSISEYVKLSNDDTYDKFIHEFMMSVFDDEYIDEDDEDDEAK